MRNNRGIVAETLLIYVVIGVIALFVPNPVSTAVGIGQRPNKTIQSDKTELIYDKEGVPVAYRHLSSNQDIQQRPNFFEWIMSLPIFVLVLMFMGVIFPPVAIVLAKIRHTWKSAFKNITKGLTSLKDTTVICRKCGDSVTIDTKEHVFDGIEKKMDNRDQKLQAKVKAELVK